MGGNAQALASAERKLGLKSIAVSFESDDFCFGIDEILFSNCASRLSRAVKRCDLLLRAMVYFDIIHFNFGRSILPLCPPPVSFRRSESSFSEKLKSLGQRLFGMMDLPLLKRLGKGIVVTYQGDDARQGDYCRDHFAVSPAPEVEEGYYSSESDAQKRRCIATMASYADRVYALNPDLLHVLPAHARFLPYANVDLGEWKPVSKPLTARPIVLHAPSHRGVKGTRFILEAVARLRREGVPFEFRLVESMTRAKARQVYEQADLLVDQLLCGWYGGVAVELMALGKPVIAYIRPEDLRFVPAEMEADLPIISATPATVYAVLKDWLTEKRAGLYDLGMRSRVFVEKWHDPLKIADGLRQEYEVIMKSKAGIA
jgi:hypothetical protein